MILDSCKYQFNDGEKLIIKNIDAFKGIYKYSNDVFDENYVESEKSFTPKYIYTKYLLEKYNNSNGELETLYIGSDNEKDEKTIML